MGKMFTKAAISTVILLASGMLISGVAFAKGKGNGGAGGTVKVQICHFNGVTYNLLRVSQSALNAHLAHGDGLPGQIVGETYFDTDCGATAGETVTSAPLALGSFACAAAICPPGSTVAGGGYYVAAEDAEFVQDTLFSMAADENAPSYPNYPAGCEFTDGLVGWAVMNGFDAQPASFTVYAVCVTPPPPPAPPAP
jgi:hypothetical protein